MKSEKTTKTTTTFILELSEEEALTLKAFVQNCPFGDNESKEESDFRLMIFNALS